MLSVPFCENGDVCWTKEDQRSIKKKYFSDFSDFLFVGEKSPKGCMNLSNMKFRVTEDVAAQFLILFDLIRCTWIGRRLQYRMKETNKAIFLKDGQLCILPKAFKISRRVNRDATAFLISSLSKTATGANVVGISESHRQLELLREKRDVYDWLGEEVSKEIPNICKAVSVEPIDLFVVHCLSERSNLESYEHHWITQDWLDETPLFDLPPSKITPTREYVFDLLYNKYLL